MQKVLRIVKCNTHRAQCLVIEAGGLSFSGCSLAVPFCFTARYFLASAHGFTRLF
jgi:hypothetical protein